MYYVGGFREAGAPDAAAMAAILEASGEPTLSAATWGAAYPDFLRLFIGQALGRFDRGWALESRWNAHVHGAHTLGEWMPGVRAGWRPIMLFNATLAETGERWILTPVTIEPRAGSGRRDLAELLPGKDLKLATAARLSATFPYVSPMAAPDVGKEPASRALHAADGGYYDNSGIVSMLDVVGEWLAWSTRISPVRRVALIEIRAGDSVGGEEPAPMTGGVGNSLLGPLRTLYAVRGASQLANVQQQLELTRAHWLQEYSVGLEQFTFRLSGEQPLSWQLTDTEKATIRRNWPGGAIQTSAAFENGMTLERLRAFLEN